MPPHRRQMKATASAWVLEFLLRQPNLDTRVLCRLISVLPVSHRNPRLLKTIFLRSISDSLGAGSVSESTLDSIEFIEDIDNAAGIPILLSMRAAYTSVAVACTATLLKDELQDKEPFMDAVNRIWKCRVCDMENANCRSGLLCKELAEAKKEILMAIWKRGKREEFLARDTLKEALDLLRVYVDQALQEMGLSLLECAAAEVCKKRTGKRDPSVASVVPEAPVVVEDGSNGAGIDQGKVAGAATKGPLTEGNGGGIDPGKLAGEATKGPSTEGDRHTGTLWPQHGDICNQNAISCMNHVDEKTKKADVAGNKYNILPPPAVAKLLKDLRLSSKNLHAIVEDPLPDALEMAAGILANMATHNDERKQSQSKADVDTYNASTVKGTNVDTGNASTAKNANVDTHNASTEKGANVDTHNASIEKVKNVDIHDSSTEKGVAVDTHDASTDKGTYVDTHNASTEKVADLVTYISLTEKDVYAHNASPEKGADVRNAGASTADHQDETSFPGFMKWNRTARTHEWDEDPIEDSSEKSPTSSMRLKLPTPEKRHFSPLKKGDTPRVLKRRKIKKWSPQEEEILRKAVKEFGRGNWKAILMHYNNDFNDRTTIDLKDKWRNMTKG